MKTGRNKYTGQPTNPNNFYIQPEDLSNEIRKSQELGYCTDRLAEMTNEMLKRVLNFPKFKHTSPEEREEMSSYTIYRWIKTGIYSCKPDGNCFSYLTSALYSNALNRLISMRRKQQQAIDYEKMILQENGKQTYENGELD